MEPVVNFQGIAARSAMTFAGTMAPLVALGCVAAALRLAGAAERTAGR